jgi:hypothetical protein
MTRLPHQIEEASSELFSPNPANEGWQIVGPATQEYTIDLDRGEPNLSGFPDEVNLRFKTIASGKHDILVTIEALDAHRYARKAGFPHLPEASVHTAPMGSETDVLDTDFAQRSE